MNSNNTLRRGVSLLEVLMAIFIITIGILGVASLLPLAAHLANRGTTADRAAVAGREAMNQFVIREMNNPDNWLTAAGAAVDSTPHLADAADPSFPMQPFGPKAYCLDPRGVAHGVTGNFAGSIPRVTLRPQPNATFATPVAMTPAQKIILADQICRQQDDLSFNIPEDATLPPVSNTFKHSTNGNAVKRLSDGDFSWLATLTRPAEGDRYTLNVVVCYKRQTPTVADEVIIPGASVTMYGGIGGGEIEIDHAAAANPHLSPGNWVMLSQGNTFAWYRVLNASKFDAAINTKRYLTLAGPDWTAGANPQLTILPGAIAVYERTVRLETATLWGR